MTRHVNPLEHVVRSRHQTKPCPFCAESIRYEAVKCRFCGEFLYGDRKETLTKLGPPPEAEVEPEADSESEEELENDILWYGRPSVLALTGTIFKVSIFVTLCGVAYKYRVTGLLARLDPYMTKIDLNAQLLSRIESYIDFGALALIVIAGLILAWKIAVLKSIYYEVTPDRIEWSRGIFDRQVDNLDMFRVIDLKLRRSILECILGIGTVRLTTKDESDPHFDFVKVRDCRYLYDVVKQAGLEADKTRNVIHVE